MKKRGALSALLGIGLLGAATTYAASDYIAEDHVPGELIVKVKDGAGDKFWSDKSLQGMAVNREIKVSFGTFYVMKIDNNKSLVDAVKLVNDSPYVEYAEPNFIYTISDSRKNILESVVASYQADLNLYGDAPVNDPQFSKLWGLNNTGDNDPSNGAGGVAGADIDAIKAWSSFSKGDRAVKIAVIDTGIDYNHEDLKNNIWVNEAEMNGQPGVDDDGNGFIDDVHGYDFANGDGDPLDGNGHGTHCSGTIAGEHDNNIGVAGVMSEVTLVAVKFLSDSGSGTTEGAIQAVDYATKMDVDLMSNSWGGGGFSQALKEAIERANEKGILFVAAAGNSSTNNDTSPHYPSNYQVDNVISVAAHNYKDMLASFSCYGRNTVHIAAPGRNILSSIPGNKYAVYSGTSMATPHVSGVLGLLLVNEGRLPVLDVQERVMMTSVPVRNYRGKIISEGRINAYNLLADERPFRNIPDPNGWRRVELDEVFESEHPYANDITLSRNISFPGAKFIRVIVKKYETESRYDFLNFYDTTGELIDSISGTGENFRTGHVEGDSMKVEFVSDRSFTIWGFVIEAIEVQ